MNAFVKALGRGVLLGFCAALGDWTARSFVIPFIDEKLGLDEDEEEKPENPPAAHQHSRTQPRVPFT